MGFSLFAAFERVYTSSKGQVYKLQLIDTAGQVSYTMLLVVLAR